MTQDHIAAHLQKIFGTNFREFSGNPEGLRAAFFGHTLTMQDLYQTYKLIADQEIVVDVPEAPEGKISVPAAMCIGDENAKTAVLQMAQVHGNEPAGLGVLLFGMALSEAGVLNGKIYGALGNHHAASYFWEAWRDQPHIPAAARSPTRTMIGEEDRMDLNRFRPDRAEKLKEDYAAFLDEMLASDNVMLHRGAKLCALARKPEVTLIFDPHTSRQEPDGIRTINISLRQMQLLESGEGVYGGLLRGVPDDIRIFPSGLLGKLGQSDPKITLKELFEAAKGDKKTPIIGIECGHHETLHDCAPRAIKFYNALLHNMGFSGVRPEGYSADKGQFLRYEVQGRLGLGWLQGEIKQGDVIYPVKPLASAAEIPALPRPQDVKHKYADPLQVIFTSAKGASLVTAEDDAGRIAIAGRIAKGEKAHLVYQFREMEEIPKGQTVMLGVPSGEALKTPQEMMVFFPTKSSYVYGNKPGMWPVEVKDVATASKAKFGYGIFEKKEFTLPLSPTAHPRVNGDLKGGIELT